MSVLDDSVRRALLLLQKCTSTGGSTAGIFKEIPAYHQNKRLLESDLRILEKIGFQVGKHWGTRAKPEVTYRIDPAGPDWLVFEGQTKEDLLRLALLLTQNPVGPPLPLRHVLHSLADRQSRGYLGAGTTEFLGYYGAFR